MTISSVVVFTSPDFLQEVIETLKKSNLCEYHLHDESGKIIVTIEAEGVETEMENLKKIQKLPHVLSASMVYSYNETELEVLKQNISIASDVPLWLNDDSVAAENIDYKGDLKKKM